MRRAKMLASEMLERFSRDVMQKAALASLGVNMDIGRTEGRREEGRESEVGYRGKLHE